MYWPPPTVALVALHLLADMVWIGALLAVATLTASARFMADGQEVGALARRVHVRLAVPAFLASLAAGAALISLAPHVYAHLPWMHAKLAFAAALIGLHHGIGARAKRVAAGDPRGGHSTGVLGVAVLVCAAATVLLGVAKALP